MDKLSFYLAGIFVREAIYRSYKPLASSKGFWRIISTILMPQPTDDLFTYNTKWFIGGVLSGLFMAIWIPLFILASKSLGLYYTAELLLVSYLTMAFLISIIIVFDLIHQVVSAIRELDILIVLDRQPLSREVVEKAASYSLLIGGGVSLLAGMGFSIGMITYIVTDNLLSTIFTPAGFISSILFIYPLALLIYRKTPRSVSGIISLIIYTLLIAFTMAVYIGFIGLSEPGQVYDTLYGYRWLYPLSFVYLSVIGYNIHSFYSSILFIVVSILLSIIIPSRYGLRIVRRYRSKTRSFRIVYSRIATLGLKDVLLLLRDRARSKQYYGQIAALVTPSIIPLITPGIVEIIRATEYFHVLFIFILYGLLSYILAVIVSPTLLFIEGSMVDVIRRNPIANSDLLYGKTTASLILIQPVALMISILVLYASMDPVTSILSYYSFTTYWVMGSMITLGITLHMLWRQNTAWTELSLGIAKRLLVSILSVLPLIIFIPLVFLMYIVDIELAVTTLLLIPAPFTALLLYKVFMER